MEVSGKIKTCKKYCREIEHCKQNVDGIILSWKHMFKIEPLYLTSSATFR